MDDFTDIQPSSQLRKRISFSPQKYVSSAWEKIFSDTVKCEVVEKLIAEPINELKSRHRSKKVQSKIAALVFGMKIWGPMEVKTLKTFLYKMLDIAVPQFVYGNSRNRRLLKSLVGRVFFETHRKRMERLLSKVDPQGVQWLQSVGDAEKLDRLKKLFAWLLRVYVVGLVDHAFSIVCGRDQELQFFLKPAWVSVCDAAFQRLLKEGQCSLATGVTEETWRDEGACVLQFRPKSGGVRPLMVNRNDSDDVKVPEVVWEICKKLLEDMWEEAFPPLACDGTKAIEAFACMAPAWKGKMVHFVKTDYHNAFGSVHHPTMKSILKTYFQHFFQPGSFLQIKIEEDEDEDDVILFDLFDEDFEECEEESQPYRAELLLGTIVKSFEKFLFKWKGKIYTLERGLPQGHILSPLLCDMYINAIDRRYLEEFISNDSLLLRKMDDYLFASTSRLLASRFYSIMKCGFPEQNMRTNKKIQTSDDGPTMRFLMFDINMEKMEIRKSEQ